MNSKNHLQHKFKGLALLSGGLDSILAIKLIQEQNIEVEAVVFVSPFFNSVNAERATDYLKIKSHKIDITEKIIEILKNPKFGFGKNLNPCIDCHLLMIKEASKLMKEIGADFLITGEVVGERPKSQNYNALKIIEKESNLKGRILRPLSAKKLEPTIMEKEGIIDREKLLGITGRSRSIQMELALKYNIKNYPTPAGGCLLTVPKFADRLRINLNIGKLDRNELEILKYGRHFIDNKNTKIIVGRNESENFKILELADAFSFIFEIYEKPGPITILDNPEPDETQIINSASLTARYSKYRNEEKVEVKFYRKNEPQKFNLIKVKPKNFDELSLKLI